MSKNGIKYDTGKDRWDLLPLLSVREVVRVLGKGAIKYGDNNWRSVPQAGDRYYSAAMRHIVEWRRGSHADPETGLHPLAHAICSLLFILDSDLESNGGWYRTP